MSSFGQNVKLTKGPSASLLVSLGSPTLGPCDDNVMFALPLKLNSSFFDIPLTQNYF
jgi:hypothetical protein